MKRTKYIVLIVLSFILYGNTLFNDYTLDDALVIIENEYTLSGFDGIGELFSEEFFSGFFDEKDKNLVAGGRYRPLSMVTFAIEWQLVMGAPFDGISKASLEKRMNQNATKGLITPSQKLLKDLSKTIHIDNRSNRVKLQESILKKVKVLDSYEKTIILANLDKMHSKRGALLFISHLLNILFYLLTVLLLYMLLQSLFQKYGSDKWYFDLPFLASLLFLAHPIHTEVVANIKGRDEIMSLLGAVLTTLIVVKYIEKPKVHFLALSFLTFLFALFSKEVAFTFVAVIPLSIYFVVENKKKGKLLFVAMVPLALASIVYFYARAKVIGEVSLEPSQELMNNSFLGMTFSEKYATIFYTLLIYIRLLIFPHPLTYDYYPYHIPVMDWGSILPILSFIIYLSLGLYALFTIKKKGIFSYGILFFLIVLSPMSNVFFPIGVFMNERFVYAASIGFVIILAYFIRTYLPQWVKVKNIAPIFLILVLALYSVKTISRNSVWKNDFTLFTNDVKVSKNSAKSNTSAGGKLIEEAVKPGNQNLRIDYLNQAIAYLSKAVKIHPTYNDAYLLLGNAHWERYNSLDSSFKYYKKVLERVPNYESVYSNIFETNMNGAFSKPELADNNIKILHSLENYKPNDFYINYYLGSIYGRHKNKLEVSIAYLEKAAEIKPNDLRVYKDLGVAYGMSKDFNKSAKALSKAIEIDTSDPVLKVNLAMTYLNMGQVEEALVLMAETKEMEYTKSNANALVNLGYLFKNLGKNTDAQECLLKAKELNPDLFN